MLALPSLCLSKLFLSFLYLLIISVAHLGSHLMLSSNIHTAEKGLSFLWINGQVTRPGSTENRQLLRAQEAA